MDVNRGDFPVRRFFTDQTGWSGIDTAPLNENVMLIVTDDRGDPYTLPHPCRRTEAGWVSSKGTPLAVHSREKE
jgi:hypothetical protein